MVAPVPAQGGGLRRAHQFSASKKVHSHLCSHTFIVACILTHFLAPFVQKPCNMEKCWSVLYEKPVCHPCLHWWGEDMVKLEVYV